MDLVSSDSEENTKSACMYIDKHSGRQHSQGSFSGAWWNQTLAWRSSMSFLKCLTRKGQELMRNTLSIMTTMKLYLHVCVCVMGGW